MSQRSVREWSAEEVVRGAWPEVFDSKLGIWNRKAPTPETPLIYLGLRWISSREHETVRVWFATKCAEEDAAKVPDYEAQKVEFYFGDPESKESYLHPQAAVESIPVATEADKASAQGAADARFEQAVYEFWQDPRSARPWERFYNDLMREFWNKAQSAGK